MGEKYPEAVDGHGGDRQRELKSRADSLHGTTGYFLFATTTIRGFHARSLFSFRRSSPTSYMNHRTGSSTCRNPGGRERSRVGQSNHLFPPSPPISKCPDPHTPSHILKHKSSPRSCPATSNTRNNPASLKRSRQFQPLPQIPVPPYRRQIHATGRTSPKGAQPLFSPTLAPAIYTSMGR